ncbi:MAG: M16 family metallopeptidase [Vulcanimicrobiaceae bacterium]
MIAPRFGTAAVLAAVLLGSPAGAAAPAAQAMLPNLGPGVSVGRLPTGGTYVVSPLAGAPVAAVELWYRAPATGFGSKPTPSLSRLAAEVVAASQPLVGKPLGSQIADAGGRLVIDAYNDSIEISALVPAASASAIVRAMTTAYFAPVVADDGYREAQQDVAQEALFSSFDPEAAIRNAIFSELFSAGPQHYPVMGPPSGVAEISFETVRAFATRAFRSQNATLVIVGAVDPSIVAAAVAGRPSDDPAPEAAATPLPATTLAPVSLAFVEPGGGRGWIGPPIGDEKAATAMDFIADYLFRSGSGVIPKAVAKVDPQAFVGGQFITLHDPGVLFVGYSAKSLAPIEPIVASAIADIQKPLERRTFAAALAEFKYHLLHDLQTPSEIADNFGWYSIEGNPAYAPGVGGSRGAYFQAADALTPDFVAQVARTYLGKPPAVVTLGPDLGKGSST